MTKVEKIWSWEPLWTNCSIQHFTCIPAQMQSRPLVTKSLGWWPASVIECKISWLSLFLLMDTCWDKYPDHPLWHPQPSQRGDASPGEFPFLSRVWLLLCSVMVESQVMRSFSYVGFSSRNDFAEGQNVPHWDVGCIECSSQSAQCPRVCLVFNKVVQLAL